MQISSPIVSVVVPAFNKADFLSQTLESIFNQTYSSYEVIVVNDGSTDRTLEIAHEIAKSKPAGLVKIIDTPNRGVAEARNIAIRASQGRYIAAIDADDLMEPRYLEEAVALLESGAGTLISCDVELFGREVGEWIPSDYDAYGERFNNNIPTLVTYSKKLWELSGGYKRAFPFNEDWDFFITCEKYGLKVAQIREKLFRYRVTDDGLASQYIKDTWSFSSSLVMTSNESSYSVRAVLDAHRNLLNMPTRWTERFTKQDQLHPQEWLLKFWLALASKSRGQIEETKSLLIHAIRLTNTENWQPLFQLAEILNIQGDTAAKSFYHQCRILRPDIEFIVDERLK